jgi:glycosyltransferase involved in cell wall biosynthesis
MSKPPLKILHVSHSLNTGGLERIILEMVRCGPEHGFSCAVATLGQGGDLADQVEDLGGQWFRLAKRDGLDWPAGPRLARLAKRWRADVLHAHNEGAGLYAGLAGRMGSRPAICTRHGLSFGAGPRGAWLRRAAGLLCRRTVCVGRDVMRFAHEEDRLPASRLALIYNGVDTQVFQPDSEARQHWRKELGIGADESAIISVGRLAPEKDYSLLLEATAHLQSTQPGVKLILVGGGPQRTELESKASSLGLRGRVLFLGARREVPGLLNAADLFALSSITEGIPMALLEAMACALPVAALDVGGVPEVVEEGRCGLLVSGRSPADLAGAMGRMMAGSRAAREMGLAARARVLERFSLEAMLNAYANLYRRLTGREA